MTQSNVNDSATNASTRTGSAQPRSGPVRVKLLSNAIADPATGCWNWKGAKRAGGYGAVRLDGRIRVAHRASFEDHKGPIPAGMDVCHRCDNPACINPDHLFLGTTADNMADMVAKGRQGAKITKADALAIRTASGTQRELAARFGISQGQISHIRSGKNWAHVGGDQ